MSDPSVLRCFNPKCGSDEISVGFEGQPANYLFGFCGKCGCRGQRTAYCPGMNDVDLSLFAVPPHHSAGVVVSERIEQIDTLLRRAHACLSPPNAEDRDPGGAQMDISEALALVAALGGEGDAPRNSGGFPDDYQMQKDRT